MALTAAEKIRVHVNCQNCGQTTDKALAWLVIHDAMPCPSCGGSIDLQSGENGFLIQKLGQHAATLDPTLTKIRENR